MAILLNQPPQHWDSKHEPNQERPKSLESVLQTGIYGRNRCISTGLALRILPGVFPSMETRVPVVGQSLGTGSGWGCWVAIVNVFVICLVGSMLTRVPLSLLFMVWITALKCWNQFLVLNQYTRESPGHERGKWYNWGSMRNSKGLPNGSWWLSGWSDWMAISNRTLPRKDFVSSCLWRMTACWVPTLLYLEHRTVKVDLAIFFQVMCCYIRVVSLGT